MTSHSGGAEWSSLSLSLTLSLMRTGVYLKRMEDSDLRAIVQHAHTVLEYEGDIGLEHEQLIFCGVLHAGLEEDGVHLQQEQLLPEVWIIARWVLSLEKCFVYIDEFLFEGQPRS